MTGPDRLFVGKNHGLFELLNEIHQHGKKNGNDSTSAITDSKEQQPTEETKEDGKDESKEEENNDEQTKNGEMDNNEDEQCMAKLNGYSEVKNKYFQLKI